MFSKRGHPGPFKSVLNKRHGGTWHIMNVGSQNALNEGALGHSTNVLYEGPKALGNGLNEGGPGHSFSFYKIRWSKCHQMRDPRETWNFRCRGNAQGAGHFQNMQLVGPLFFHN